ncbi:MAG: hypothetical protein IPH49_15770 [Ignavibacteria bacterium]|nr:hypothetical protein [Ignavibacteria bacterium]
MAKTRITDEGLILTNDNGVDVMIKANHAATVDSYVLPPAADGTISTGQASLCWSWSACTPTLRKGGVVERDTCLCYSTPANDTTLQ